MEQKASWHISQQILNPRYPRRLAFHSSIRHSKGFRKAINASYLQRQRWVPPRGGICGTLSLQRNSQDVTLEEVNDAVKKYILPIFNSSSAIASITSSKDKASEMKKQLQDIGFNVQILEISGSGDEASDSGEEGSMASDSEDEGSMDDQSGSSESWQIEDGDTKMQ